LCPAFKLNKKYIHNRNFEFYLKIKKFTLSPATFLGGTFFMIHTASMTILTPSGGLFMAFTSVTSFLFNDFKLCKAASLNGEFNGD
jgi:hypothetical protein